MIYKRTQDGTPYPPLFKAAVEMYSISGLVGRRFCAHNTIKLIEITHITLQNLDLNFFVG